MGVEVRLLNYRSFTRRPVDDFTPLHSAALADGRSAVQRIDARDVYASSFPVFASTGEAIVLIETRLPASGRSTTSARRLMRRLLVTALVLAALAVLAGVLLGQLRRAARCEALTAAAAAPRPGRLLHLDSARRRRRRSGTLARTMEDMRRNLVDLTGTLRRREAEAQAVLGGIVEGVYAVDENRIIRYLNPQAAKLLGVTPDEAVGRFCGDVLKPAATRTAVVPATTAARSCRRAAKAARKAVEQLQTPAPGAAAHHRDHQRRAWSTACRCR